MLDRLTSQDVEEDSRTWQYDYDPNHNRVRRSDGGGLNEAYSYQPNSNRMVEIDKLIDKSEADRPRSQRFVYNQAGRLAEYLEEGATQAVYTYNALGQRTSKTLPDETKVFHYGTGFSLLGETEGTGSPLKDYVWLDNLPLAQIEATGTVVYLHADHLQTPRLGTSDVKTIVWRWEGEAFGDVQAQGPIEVNLRFPGQYFDRESGRHYNYFRDYGPGMGRYIESDPIGLEGGLNTYGYVSQRPLNSTDPTGLLENFTLTLNKKPTTTLSCECGEDFPVFSGLGDAVNDPNQIANTDIGPIPTGRYYIVSRQSGGRLGWLRDFGRSALGNDPTKWYALVPIDGNIDDCTVVNGVVRCGFRIHPGERSLGCITFTNDKEFFRLRELLDKTETGVIPGTNRVYFGTVTVQ